MISTNNALSSVDLAKIARNASECVKTTLQGCTSINQFLIGYHLRHVLDPKAPTVAITASSDQLESLANNAHGCLDRLGLYSLNHVVDLLYYSSPNDWRPNAKARPRLIVVRMTFDMTSEESRHHFDDEEYVTAFKVWVHLPQGQKSEHDDVARFLNKNVDEFVFVRMGVRTNSVQERFKLLQENSSADIVTLGALFDDPEFVFDHYVCGVQKLCDRLGVQPSLLSYRSLIAAIVQLGGFLNVGSEVVSVLARPTHPWSVVHGVTVVSKGVMSTEEMAKLVQLVESIQNGREPHEEPDKGSVVSDLRKALRFTGLQFLGSATPHDASAVSKIAHAMVIHLNDTSPDNLLVPSPFLHNPDIAFRKTFASFLKIATAFCEEYSEGRPLRYGLLLGNARLMQFWPGPAPIPLQRGDKPMELDDLPDMFHLVENPAARALVIPYMDVLATRHYPATTWVVELQHFREALNAFADGTPWGEDLLPYVYFSRVYPWCVGCVVGPGAAMRIFVRGDLLAYRDGKGWRCAGTQWFNPMNRVKRTLIRLALQLSPIARPGSHGSLLAYVAEITGQFWDTEEKYHRLVPLKEVEPVIRKGVGGQPDERWLTGRPLLNQGDNHDRVVFERLVRAGSLDGAIVLEGNDCKVARFAQQLVYQEKTGGEGTKRAAASAFVKKMREQENRRDVQDKTAYAVAISSDGPIGFYDWNDNVQDVLREDVFQLIEE